MHNFQFDEAHKGTLATIVLSVLGWLDVSVASQFVFMMATLTTGTLTSIYTYKKIKKLDNEKNSEKY